MLIQYTFNQDIENNSCFVPLCTDNFLISYYQTEKKKWFENWIDWKNKPENYSIFSFRRTHPNVSLFGRVNFSKWYEVEVVQCSFYSIFFYLFSISEIYEFLDWIE